MAQVLLGLVLLLLTCLDLFSEILGFLSSRRQDSFLISVNVFF